MTDALWLGEELFDRPGWLQPISVDAASLATGSVSAIEPSLEKVQQVLETGCGAVRVTGLPLDRMDDEARASAFRAMCERIGTPISQSAAGETLIHVRDEQFREGDPRVRGPLTNRELAFHTDRCDVIAFCCIRPAAEGGISHVLSSERLYRDLLRDEPETARILEGVFPYLRHTVDGGNERPFTWVPVFTEHEGRFAGSLLRVLIDRADASPEAPNLTVEQRAALDRLVEVCEDPKRYASFRLEAGDVLFLNNWVTFHRRTAFVDAGERRHLMRIWLSMPNSRALDPRFEDHFGATAAGALRGGMKPAE